MTICSLLKDEKKKKKTQQNTSVFCGLRAHETTLLLKFPRWKLILLKFYIHKILLQTCQTIYHYHVNIKLHCTGISISKPQNPVRIVLQYLITIHIQFILHSDSKRTVCAQDSQQRTQMKYCAACHFHEHSLLEPHDKEQTEILCSMSLIHMKLTSILSTFYPQLNESINIPIQNKFFTQKNLEKTY